MRSPKPGRLPDFSPTKLGTFIDCPTKYKYIYVDRIGRFYQKPHAYFSFGSTLHQVLQSYHGPDGAPSLDFLLAKLNDRWISSGYETISEEAEYRQRAVEILTMYHERMKERSDDIVTDSVERNLSLDMGRFKLTGRIDRIDRYSDGSFEVVDYKSGRDEVTREDVLRSLAMRCYMLLVSRTMLATSVVGTIIALRTCRSASVVLTPEQLVETVEEVTKLGDTILETDITAVEPVRIEICESCEFLSRCQRFWGSRGRRQPGTT